LALIYSVEVTKFLKKSKKGVIANLFAIFFGFIILFMIAPVINSIADVTITQLNSTSPFYSATVTFIYFAVPFTFIVLFITIVVNAISGFNRDPYDYR